MMSVNSTEVNPVNDKKSSQLLFFDTLTANNPSNSDELPTESVECIRFTQRVILSEIRIVPKNTRPFKGSRKGDHTGQTSPNKFDLHLLIHKTLTIDSAKPEKRPPLPLHPLTISFDERKGFLSYDVTLLPEATTRFIIIRGNYHAVTLCIYGRAVEMNRPQTAKSKELIGASTFNEPQNNKKDHGDNFINNGTDISLEKQSMHISVSSSAIANNNNNGKKIVDNETSDNNKTVNKENEAIIDGASLNKTSTDHNATMDGVQKERTIPFVEPILSVDEKASQFSAPMDVDTFCLDDGIRDVSDVERIGILLRKDRSDSFRILNPQTLTSCVGLDLRDKETKDLLVFHSSPDETILSSTLRTFSEIEFKKAWDDFVDRIQNVDSLISTLLNSNIEGMVVTNAFELERIVNLLVELFHQISDVIIEGCLWARFQSARYDDKLDILNKSIIFALDISAGKSSVKLFESGLTLFCKLCKCGEDFINLSLVQSSLKLMVPLLIEPHVSSILQTRILRGLLECMEETRVVESLLGWCDKNYGYDTLYKTYILPMLQVKRLSSRTLHLLQAIVKKVSVYEACTLIQQMADNELRHESSRRKNDIMKNDVTNDNIQHDANSMLVDENPQEQDDVELIIEQVIDCLQIISKAALYHLALNSSDEINQDYPTTFSFRYLTSCRLFSAITILLSSQRIRTCSRFHELVNSLGKLCIILLGAPVGMIYLTQQLQQSRDQLGNSLMTIWSNLLCQQNQELNLQDETDESFTNIHPISNEGWSDVDEIRRTPGVGDIWCGLGQSTSGGNYDEDYDYICDYSEDESSVNDEENYNVRKARQILKMQSYGAIGSDSDCLDKCIIPPDQLVILLINQIHAVAVVERLLEIGRRGLDNIVNYPIIMELLCDLFEMTTFNVGKQAVASTIIYLDALPTILSLVNIAPTQDTALNSAASDALNAFGRIPLELLELAIKFSQAFPFLLTHQMHELLFSVVSSESNLRSLWEPIAVFHETGTIQGVIDIIKHQKYYPECLRDHHVVNQILVALKLLMSYTYTEGGILQILKARMDDFSGFDNGDTFFVFLLRLLNHSAEILSDMSDFVVYADHQTTAESAFTTTNDEQTSISQEHKDNPKLYGNTTEHNKNDSQSSNFTTSSVVLSSEVFEHRRELLDLVWHNLILIRRLLRVVYGNPKNSAAKRHFKNIYGKDELPDDPLPSQKKSMIQICIEPLLMLMSALDRLDGRLSDQLGAVSLLGCDQPFKNGQSVQIARIRGLLLGMFGLLSQVIIEEKDSASVDMIGEFQCRSRFFSDFSGRHIVKHLINFIFEGPDNFLSGLHILNEILPTPLPKNQKYQQSSSQDHAGMMIPDENLNFIDGYSLSASFSDVQMEAQILREYWVDQLLPLRDDIMQLIKSLAPASSKIIHIMLRAVICQLIDLDVHDRGIGRSVVSIIVSEVRKALIQCQSTLEKIKNQKVSLNADELKEGTERADDTVGSSSELETKLALFGRWMSLLTSLASNPSGKSAILDFLTDAIDDTLNCIDKQGLPEVSRGLLPLFLDFINTTSTANFIYDLIMEFLFSICNHSIISPDAVILAIDDLSLIIDNLLDYVKIGKNGRFQNQSLIILKKIVETEIGVLLVLTKQEHRQFIVNMISWVPNLLRSSDLRMQDLNIAYNLVVFILKVISYIPRIDDESIDIEIDPLSMLIDAHEDLETFNAYENIEQHVLELSFDSNRIDEDIMLDNHLCQSIVNVIRTLKEHFHAYARTLKQNDRLVNRDEVIKKYDLRLLEVAKTLHNDNVSSNHGINRASNFGTLIDDYPDIPFYDVVEDPEGKEIVGGLFNEPDVDIDFDAFSKEMLPNFQFHKKMKMSEDNMATGRKLLKTRTLSKLGGIAYESNARRNLGGGKTYQKNEFRSIHNNRKANTSRPPSVHVDDFMSGKIPANQQHPGMITPTSTATTSAANATTTKKINVSKRGGITTAVPSPQVTTSSRGGRGRRPSTSSTSTSRGASRGASSSGRGGSGVGRGGGSNASMISAWDIGSSATWTGGPPSLPMLMGQPLSKYIGRMDGQRDYTRYDNQTMRTGYYDNQYYGIPSPMTPYDRPPVPQSAPGIGPRIKGGSENRGRTIPQEWPPRSVASQPARRPERPFGRR